MTRPVRPNRRWGGAPQTNRVGTHEFMDRAELLDAQAHIAGKLGSMPPRAMSQWLACMTSTSADSTLANERRRHGGEQPWQLPCVGVGHESRGCGGTMRPEYAADLQRQDASFVHGDTVKAASGDGEGRDQVTAVTAVTAVMLHRAGVGTAGLGAGRRA